MTGMTGMAGMTGLLTTTRTHCPYCSLQCGIELTAGDRPVTLQPQPGVGLCSKGWTAAELLDHPDRLLRPLVRGPDGELHGASWDEAMERIADGIRQAQERYGADAVGCFGGGGLTNEKAYALGKFARVALRTPAIDYNGRWCMSSAAAAANSMLGIDRGLPFPLADIAGAEAVLLVGSNVAETMPPAMQYFDAGRAEGARHIVVDTRATPTARGSHLHLQPRPGTDLALANGLLHLAIRRGLCDHDYIAARTKNFEKARAAVMSFWPDRVERITGIPEAQLHETLDILTTARSAMILTARGAEQHSAGTRTAQAFLNLALALGLPGRPHSGWGTLTGQGNGQGGREHGQKADQLPGYRKLDDPAAREHVAGVWGIHPDELPQPGLSAYEMLDRMGAPGGVRALLVMASNIAVSAPNARHVRDRLKALDLLVVSDIFLTETAALADVVLPTAQWAEEEGTMTNLEGRIIRRRRALAPPEGVRDDLTFLADLAGRLGRGEFFSEDPRTVFAELKEASRGGVADYSGVDYEGSDQFWPRPEGSTVDSSRLFADGFPTADGRATFMRTDYREPAEPADAAYPYLLTTGRVMQHYQSGAQTRRVRSLRLAQPEAFAEIHPDLARRNGIGSGDMVELSTRRGRAQFRARLTDTVRPDTIFVPFHWSGRANANDLTNPVLDQFSRMPAFKVCAVAVRRAETPVEERTVMHSSPRFLQGIFRFTGHGLQKPAPVDPALSFTVPAGKAAQALYFRGGNSSSELITVVLLRDGAPMRYFPIGARSDVHVPLRVVEDLTGGTLLELHLAAPAELEGTLVIDFGLVEV
ncbi:molybdopterin oxidoreductase family protein [Kineosporia sp. NBRC 101731]|uniref:molybdopterin oxidoreductase family protein n=1 Tax=Kineosporia sp. NBRC 101731 TaxID=3032199 RepID=UPI00249F9FDB|nr:molybdopterin oxidoreductase family protein [Kineosporia sp. NBRC 101731]GLY33195.1 molybdopterin oxidoreductase [Kineosporia sp. NBRC 101731]